MYTSPRTSSTAGSSAAGRLQRSGHGADRRHVGGDVLTDAPVAPRCRLLVAAALVADAHRQPVDLQLADVRHRFVRQAAGDAGAPRLELLASHRVVEAHHRDGVRHRSEQRARRPTDISGQGVVDLDIRILRGEGAQLADEGVEVAVGDLRIVELVVTAVVIADQFGEGDQSCFRLLDRCRYVVAHQDRSSQPDTAMRRPISRTARQTRSATTGVCRPRPQWAVTRLR